MWEKVGIVRNGKDLSAAFKQLKAWDRVMKDAPLDRGLLELRNMVSASMLITRSAPPARRQRGRPLPERFSG